MVSVIIVTIDLKVDYEKGLTVVGYEKNTEIYIIEVDDFIIIIKDMIEVVVVFLGIGAIVFIYENEIKIHRQKHVVDLV